MIEDFATMPQLILISLDQSGDIDWLSQAAESYLGRSLLALRGRNLNSVLPAMHPLLDALKMGGDVTIYNQEFHSQHSAMRQFDLHIQARPSQGTQIAIYPRGNMEGHDQTHAARSAARAANNLSSVLAHELRNPLGSILGAAQLLGGSVAPADQPLIDMIEEETARIDRLVNEFEDIAGQGVPNIQAVNIHAVLDKVARMAEAGFAQEIDIERDYDPSLPELSADEDWLQRALLNLVKNSAEAIHDYTQTKRGKIKLQTRHRMGVSRGKKLPVEIRIQDNGGGVDPLLVGDIFKPFVSTKSGGSGLGLSIVARSVESLGGMIEHRHVKDGTEFSILLPTWSPS